MQRILVGMIVAAALVVLCSNAEKPRAAGLETQVVQMALHKRPLEGRDDIGYGNCQWLHPFEKPRETGLALPALKSAKPVFYGAVFGDSKDSTFTLLIDESGGTGSGYDTLYVDSNNDNRIDEKTERHSFEMGTRTSTPRTSIYVEFQICVGGKTAAHHYHFKTFWYPARDHPDGKVHATLRNGSYYTGEAVIAGKRRKIALADLNSNGLFNDPEPSGSFSGERFFVDLADRGTRRPGDTQLESFPYGQYTEIAGDWYSIAATADGSRIEITPANPRFGRVAAPARITRAVLACATQSVSLDFSKPENRAIVGTYSVREVTLRERSPRGAARELRGGSWSGGREVTVREGKTTRLVAGPPLRVEIRPSPSEKVQTVDLGLVLIGSAGEIYEWNEKANEPAPPPGFEIRNPSGKTIAAGVFEYG